MPVRPFPLPASFACQIDLKVFSWRLPYFTVLNRP